jgi:hypothetical protein
VNLHDSIGRPRVRAFAFALALDHDDIDGELGALAGVQVAADSEVVYDIIVIVNVLVKRENLPGVRLALLQGRLCVHALGSQDDDRLAVVLHLQQRTQSNGVVQFVSLNA